MAPTIDGQGQLSRDDGTLLSRRLSYLWHPLIRSSDTVTSSLQGWIATQFPRTLSGAEWRIARSRSDPVQAPLNALGRVIPFTAPGVVLAS